MPFATRTPRRAFALVGAAAMLALAGCGSDDNESADSGSGDTAGAASLTAPAAIKSAGEIAFCSDIAYPPLEFYEGTTAKGADIDIATELAKRMGVDAEFANTGFDGIIASLKTKKCDAIISSLTNSEERRKEIAFVDYAEFGLATIVKKGETGITSIADLAGKDVAVQVGTTTKQTLEAESKKLPTPIKSVIFPKDTDAANALRAGKVDAWISDAPPAADFIAKTPGQFELAPLPQIDAAPVGIGLRLDDTELKTALQEGITAMTSDGSLQKILDKWGMGDSMLKS
ncbi:MAG: ABC transporter substrate-binding protein [Solirubrobacteraceae bacterium]|nr:ABC transporter substrate-binding protein [Solirubrobacteraceae bacterium]